MTDETCGHPTDNGEGDPCQNPVTEGDSCWIDSHGGSTRVGREKDLDDDKQEAIYAAVGSGLKADHVAAAAGISRRTLNRWVCCVDDIRKCTLSTDDPCDFCQGYAQAHAEGARSVLDECRPEFRASASYGYSKTERREIDADVDQTTTHELGDDEKSKALETLRQLQEAESE